MEGVDFVFWNWTVVVYLFVAGVSAGAFAISAFAYVIGKEKYQDVARIGAYIAPFPLILGLLCLIYDLERPRLFWKLMVHLQTHSVMSLGTWLLLIFSLLSFAYFYLWLPDRFDVVDLVRYLTRRFDKWRIVRAIRMNAVVAMLQRKNLNRFRRWIGLAGIPVALGVGIYTGILLSVLAARPFWNNPMLPMLFLISALKTGTASICLIGCFIRGFGEARQEGIKANKFVIHAIDFILVVLSIIAILLFILGLYTSPQSSVEAAAGLIMGGEFTFLFWGLAIAVGVLLPFSLEAYELIPHFVGRKAIREHNPWVSGVATLSVLVGGFFLRYVVVYAGQVAKIVTT
jgi:formate-dependent nitrite reductase membrane component NrfD